MELPTKRRALTDAAIAMAAFLVAGTWFMMVAYAESGPLLYAALGAGAAIMGSAALTILGRTPPLITPADRVTLVRAVLVACCAAMAVAAIIGGRTPGVLFTAVGSVAFVLDAVDGAVARYFGCASPAGAKLDVQTDAALILVLSCAAVRSYVFEALDYGARRWYPLGVTGRGQAPGTSAAATLAGRHSQQAKDPDHE